MRRDLHAATTHIAFLLTGVATAVLGAALPAMLAEWRLSDRGGGGLLFCAFVGSTLGALLTRGKLRLLAPAGLGSTAAATLYLGWAHGGRLEPAFLLYGVGLGFAMTAITVQRSREAAPAERQIAMNRLNLLWAIGACLAPALAVRSLHLVTVRTLFYTEAGALGLVALLLGLESATVGRRFAPPPDGGLGGDIAQRAVPIRLCLLAGSAVAIETAIGGWLTTYTERAVHGVGVAVWANSAFWAGLLVSRALHSLRPLRWLATETSTGLHLLAVTGALLWVVLFPLAATLPPAAFLAGLGLGPLYPLALSLALPRYRGGALFVVSGVGSALLPWATGTLSTASGSLRVGFTAPCATVVVLLAAALLTRKDRRTSPFS